MNSGPEPLAIPVPSFQSLPGRLVTARSYLIDRIVPDCEIVTLPGRVLPGGEIRLRPVRDLPAPVRPGRGGRFWPKRGKAAPHEPLQGDVGVDFRVNTPQNWAHFLTNHAPLAFLICEHLGGAPDHPTFILPAAIPAYVLRAAGLLGLRVQVTDATVVGPGMAFDLDSWGVLRPGRRDWLWNSGAVERVAQATVHASGSVPERVFLARRKTRAVSNQAEIEALLASRGFVTVYPEDLDADGQFRLFQDVREMVAVHGAGLGPLIFRHPQARLEKLVEILPCGHMTDVFRVIAQQVGCDWIGVRGRLKPEYVKPAYDFSRPFRAYSLDGFEVDPVSLEHALDLAGIG